MLRFLAKLILAAERADHPIAQSMREAPQDWKLDQHHATHKSDQVQVWICNGVEHIHFETRAKPTSSYASWETKVEPSKAEKRLIFAALQPLREAHKAAQQREADRALRQVLNVA